MNRYENYRVALRTASQTQVTNKRDTPNPNTFFKKINLFNFNIEKII